MPILMAAIAFVPGCGGGESWASRVESACYRVLEDVRTLDYVAEAEYTEAEEGDAEATATLEKVFSKYVAIQEAGLAELRGLTPPDDDAAGVQTFLTSYERLVAFARDDLRALRSHELQGFLEKMSTRHVLGVDVTKAAARLDLTCAPPHAPPH
jgi:hypothetical protein